MKGGGEAGGSGRGYRVQHWEGGRSGAEPSEAKRSEAKRSEATTDGD
jgi:hypothetical protein